MDIEKTYDKIYRFAYFKTHDREIAEDITQETFLRYIARYGQGGNYNMRLMYTIARNLCIDEFRKDAHIPLPDDEQLYESARANVSERLILMDALKQLTDEEKGMLLLRYVNGESIMTISELYQCSRFSTYRRLKNARKKFCAYMEVKECDG